MSEPDRDVVVVGGGPVGVTLLNLLGVHGLTAAGFEREALGGHSPRAGSFDGEVMRIFQSARLAETIAPTVSPGVGLRLVNEAGTTLLAMDNREAFGPQAWAVSYRMYQPTLERLLREGLMCFARVSLHSPTQVISVGQDATPNPSGSSISLPRAFCSAGRRARTTGAAWRRGCAGSSR